MSLSWLSRSGAAVGLLALVVVAPSVSAQLLGSVSEADREAVVAIEDARRAAGADVKALREEVALLFREAQATALAEFEAEKRAAVADFRLAANATKAEYAAAREEAAAACAASFPDSAEARATCESDAAAAEKAAAKDALAAARADARARIAAAKDAFHAAVESARSESRATYHARLAEIKAAYEGALEAPKAELRARGADESAVRAALAARGDPAAKSAADGAFAVRSAALTACRAADGALSVTVEGRRVTQEACDRIESAAMRSTQDVWQNPAPACAQLLALVDAGRKGEADAVEVNGARLDAADCRRTVQDAKPFAEAVVTDALKAACQDYVTRYREATALDPRAAPAAEQTRGGVALSYGACVRALDEGAAARVQLAEAAGATPQAREQAREAVRGAIQQDIVSPARSAAIEEACGRLVESGRESVRLERLGVTLTRERCVALGAAAVEVSK